MSPCCFLAGNEFSLPVRRRVSAADVEAAIAEVADGVFRRDRERGEMTALVGDDLEL